MFTQYTIRYGDGDPLDCDYTSAYFFMVMLKKLYELNDWDFDDPDYENYN
jgi:hypothetical protein